MAKGGGKYIASDVEAVKLDPEAQAAVNELAIKEERREILQNRVKWFVVILLLLTMPSCSLDFYCRYMIGSDFDALLNLKYPSATEKIVRAAVISDELHLKIFGPVLKQINDQESLEFRKAIIDLGLAITGDGKPDTEKIQELKDDVAAHLAKSPELVKKGIASAVCRLPPKTALPPGKIGKKGPE